MSGLSPAMIGALVGLVLAIVDNFMIRFAISQAPKSRRLTFMRWMSVVGFVVFPLVGYILGPKVLH